MQFDTAEGLLEYLLQQHGAQYANKDFVFRGEPRKYTSVLSPIDRVTIDRLPNRAIAVSAELGVIVEFWQSIRLTLPIEQHALVDDGGSILPLMRHYEAPTRLLDWTISPWIAAHFSAWSNLDEDGRILSFDRNSASIHLKPNRGTLEYFQPIDYRGVSVPKVLVDSISGLDDWLVPYHHIGPQFPRIVSQQGMFTLASNPWIDHWEMIKNHEHVESYEIHIRADIKAGVMRRLRRMGITSAALFPDPVGIGWNVRDRLISDLNER